MIGEMVGNYRVLSELAGGGMGKVYVAEHKHMQRRAAIKFLLPELSQRQDIIARFFDEARAASHVDHEGIVQIFDCDYHPGTGQAYLVMELLQGSTLRHRLQSRAVGHLDEAWARRVARGIAEPLSAAHAKGIVHRDLKPENVFLVERRDKETVKVLDFGIAKLSAALKGQSTSTIEGSILGTPLYMSPEQCRGARELDSRADVYSLGCMLFEMVCDRPPFVRDTPTALIAAHLSDVPEVPRTLNPAVSRELSELIVQMLAKDASGRPASMDEVIERLGAMKERAAPPSADARRADALRPTLPASASSTTLGATASENLVVPGGAPRSRLRVVGLVGAIALGAAIVAGLAFTRRPGPPATVSAGPPAAAPPLPAPARPSQDVPPPAVTVAAEPAAPPPAAPPPTTKRAAEARKSARKAAPAAEPQAPPKTPAPTSARPERLPIE